MHSDWLAFILMWIIDHSSDPHQSTNVIQYPFHKNDSVSISRMSGTATIASSMFTDCNSVIL